MIISIRLSNLRNNELLQFIKDIINRCSRFNTEVLKLSPAVSELELIADLLEKAYNKENGSDFTELLTKLDAARDRSITGIKLLCEANTYQTDKQIANAAALVLNSITRYGHSIAKLNYQAETTVLERITNNWERDKKLTKCLEILHLTKWANVLKKQNIDFSLSYQDRIDDKLKNNIESFSDLRATAINTYKALCDNIFAYSIINNKKEYSSLIEAINIIIEDYNTILAKRETKAEE